MYQTLIIEYMNGSIEELYVYSVCVSGDVLEYSIPYGQEKGAYGIPLVNIKRYRVIR